MENITRVFIENMPTPDAWYIKLAPTFIGTIALILSIVSIHYTKRAFIRNSRPYIWALSSTINDEKNTLIPCPETILMKISNVPAKVLTQNFKIFLDEKNGKETILFQESIKNQERFPSEDFQWSYNINKNDFSREVFKLNNDQKDKELRRKIEIIYTTLYSSKKYSYELTQRFIRQDNQWRDL